MLLNPTLNSSLSATSNNMAQMSETVRQSMSSSVYVYEVVNGSIDLLSEQIIHGMKWIARNGITHSTGINYTISYNDLTGHSRSGTL